MKIAIAIVAFIGTLLFVLCADRLKECECKQEAKVTMQIICFVVGIGVGGMLVYLSPLAR